MVFVHQITVGPAGRGKRLDHFLQEELAQYSRSRLQAWIKTGHVTVNGWPSKPSHELRAGEEVRIEPVSPPPLKAFAEDLPVRILYEDDDVVAVDKPAGMVVHAGAGRHAGTLVNALLHHFGALSSAGGDDRPGIVHRLDKETSGVLLVARTDVAHRSLAAQFASREVEKIYLALVLGALKKDRGLIDAPIERDSIRRTRMTAKTHRGRKALTQYRVLQRYERFTYLEVALHTGRTHQIRVHMAHIGHPVAGDTVYGAPVSPEGRHFLHAHRIAFRSPSRDERVVVESPLPPELEHWRAGLL